MNRPESPNPASAEHARFFEILQARRSVRAYESRAIEEDKLGRILEAVNRAPSAGNLQAYEVIVVRDSAARHALARACLGQGFIAAAPVALVFCAHPRRSAVKYGNRGESLYCLQDATIACAYAQLAATALGLACVWVGAFDTKGVAAAIGSPPGWHPIAVLPVGYPAEQPSPSSRRSLSDLVHELPPRS